MTFGDYGGKTSPSNSLSQAERENPIYRILLPYWCMEKVRG
jgi:hypothetical protein